MYDKGGAFQICKMHICGEASAAPKDMALGNRPTTTQKLNISVSTFKNQIAEILKGFE